MHTDQLSELMYLHTMKNAPIVRDDWQTGQTDPAAVKASRRPALRRPMLLTWLRRHLWRSGPAITSA